MAIIASGLTSDIDEVLALEQATFGDNTFNEKTLHDLLLSGEGFLLLAKQEDVLVGYALVGKDGYVWDLLKLGVHPSHQGQGYGGQLVDAVREKCPCTLMLTVDPTNQRALSLYWRKGFSLYGRIEGHYVLLSSPRSKRARRKLPPTPWAGVLGALAVVAEGCGELPAVGAAQLAGPTGRICEHHTEPIGIGHHVVERPLAIDLLGHQLLPPKTRS